MADPENDSTTYSGLNTSDLADDFYDYDPNDSGMGLPITEVTLVSIFYSLTLLLGVVGNVLVIFSILRYRRMQNVTNAFLTSLATADLLLVLLCVPIKFAKWFSHTWDFGWFLCKGVHCLQNVTVICSVLTLTAMSMERYYAILHPMRARYACTVKRARRVCLVVWALSFLLAAPTFIIQHYKEVGQRVKGYWCIDRRTEGDPEEYLLYFQIFAIYMLILILILPLSIMSFAYISICRELWIVTSARRQMRSGLSGTEAERESCCVNSTNAVSDKTSVFPRKQKLSVDDDSTRKQVIKMLVAVILLFAICWGPAIVDNVLIAFEILDGVHYGFLKHMRQAFAIMSYFNSCVNPIVYAFMSRNFRETFKYALCGCIHGKRGNRDWWSAVGNHQEPSRSLPYRSVLFRRRSKVSSCHVTFLNGANQKGPGGRPPAAIAAQF